MIDLANLPVDALDLDGDGDSVELLPLDALGLRRVVNGYLDFGAFEWQTSCLSDISPSSPGTMGDGTVTSMNCSVSTCVADVNGDNSVDV